MFDNGKVIGKVTSKITDLPSPPRTMRLKTLFRKFLDHHDRGIRLTEPVHLSQEYVSQNETSYSIPETCVKIEYSIVHVKHDTLLEVFSIFKTRVTYVRLPH